MTSSHESELDPAAWIASTLGLSLDQAEHILLLTQWVEHERLIERYGYPRDNILPEPLSTRFDDPAYLARLVDAESQEEPPDEEIVRALARRREGLQSSS